MSCLLLKLLRITINVNLKEQFKTNAWLDQVWIQTKLTLEAKKALANSGVNSLSCCLSKAMLECTAGQHTPGENKGDTDYMYTWEKKRNRWKQSGIIEDNQAGDAWGKGDWPELRGELRLKIRQDETKPHRGVIKNTFQHIHIIAGVTKI